MLLVFILNAKTNENGKSRRNERMSDKNLIIPEKNGVPIFSESPEILKTNQLYILIRLAYKFQKE